MEKNTLTSSTAQSPFFTDFMAHLTLQLKSLGREGTAQTYTSAQRSLTTFFSEYTTGSIINDTGRTGIPFSIITSDFFQAYEAWLRQRGVTPNTISFYMRILRAVYNKAIENGLMAPTTCHPFKHVYTGIAKTRKRALPLLIIRRMKELNLQENPRLAFARDMFLFSFYTRGMSFVDMAYLEKSDLKADTLVYRRRKTGTVLYIKWETPMRDIVARYSSPQSPYMLSIIIDAGRDARTQYLNMLHQVNRSLKQIAGMLLLTMPLSLYCARHSWASAAHEADIPLAVISQGMGHASEQVTRIYLADLHTSVVDAANSKILGKVL